MLRHTDSSCFDYESIITTVKQKTYIIIAIICFTCIFIGIVGSYLYDPSALDIYLLTGLPAATVVLLVLLLLFKKSLIVWIERIGAATIVLYLIAWAVANIVLERIPDNHFVISNTPTVAMAIMFLSLAVPQKFVFRTILTFFCIHTSLVWVNMLQFPWTDFHLSQMTNDILMLCVVFTVSLIATYSHTLMLAQVDTKNMYQLANTDMLTGLINRRAMYHILTQRPWNIIIQIDIDYFKYINDTQGHEKGDEALMLVSAVLNRIFDPHGFVARWGGEEFIISLETNKLDKAIKLAEDARQAVAVIDFAVPITVSLGVAKKQGNEELRAVLKRADVLLYKAKNSGRNMTKYE